MRDHDLADHGDADEPAPSTWRRAWKWVTFATSGLIACVLGYMGFEAHAAASATASTVADLAYRTVQLFVLESGDVGGPVPWQLEIARVLAPLVSAWAALHALGVLFREQREAFWLHRRRDHVVVCGLGRKGMQLVRDFRRDGEDVVVIECDPDNPRLAACRYLGASILIGSCTDRSLLERARAGHARHVIAITGDDSTNVEVAILVHQLVRGRSPGIPGRVRCHVHVVELKLFQLLERMDLLSSPGDRFTATVFNSFQNGARTLLATYPLEPDRFEATDPRTVHLILIGFGKMGESVALQAAKLAHYANGKRLRITAVDQHAAERRREFAARYPQFGMICDLEFSPGTEESPEVRSKLRAWANDPDSVTSVAICLDGDSASLGCTLRIMEDVQDADVSIYVRMSAASGLATLFTDRQEADRWEERVRPFGMTTFTATRTLLLNQERDILARAFHRDYVAKRKLEGKPETEPNMQEWERLGVGLQDSNRQLADHLPVKLRAIGCVRVAGTSTRRVEEFEAAEVETLARMEHARWCAERYLAGWRRGPKDVAKRQSENLVDWEELSEEFREYDRQTVRCVPKVLRLIEESVGRVGEAVGEQKGWPR